MAFTDMIQSSRGPGVIGMLMALLVLLGFGLLFMMAFDEEMQGGDQSIESLIARQGKEIDHLENCIIRGRTSLGDAPALMELQKKLTALNRENQFRDDKMSGLRRAIVESTEALARKTGELEAYKDEYRVLVRARAKGLKLEKLETRKGEIYENVNIREVTSIGVQIIHDGGHKRIPFEDLPEALQDQFQYDAQQKAEALAKEQAQRHQHEAAVAAAQAVGMEKAAGQRQKEREANREKLNRSIAVYESRIGSLREEIDSLQRELPFEREKKLSRAPQMRAKISGKQREISDLRAKVAEMRQQL